MINFFRNKMMNTGAAIMTGVLMASGSAKAAAPTMSTIGTNITNSVSTLPGMLAGFAYLFGVLIGVLGVLKIKDHVENPSQVALKDGAIRLAAGGALFALPLIYDAMQGTVGADTAADANVASKLNKVIMQTN